MKSDEEIIKSLIVGGLIGAELGAVLSTKKNMGDDLALGALATAVILATYKANEKAMQTKVPLYVEDAGNLYKIESDGVKKFIRKIDKPIIKLQTHFKLK